MRSVIAPPKGSICFFCTNPVPTSQRCYYCDATDDLACSPCFENHRKQQQEKKRSGREYFLYHPDTRNILKQKILTAKLDDDKKTEKKFDFFLTLASPHIPQKFKKQFIDKDTIREISINDIMEQAGHSGRQFNGRTKYLCPFHNENTASFVVFDEKNNAHCFGCQYHGDVIDVYMQLYKVGFKEALNSLNNLV